MRGREAHDRRRRLAVPDEAVLARLLISLAHDRALQIAFAHGAGAPTDRGLKDFFDALWVGLRHRQD